MTSPKPGGDQKLGCHSPVVGDPLPQPNGRWIETPLRQNFNVPASCFNDMSTGMFPYQLPSSFCCY